jgi:transglutaminase-like putative cysteine protease
VSTVAKRRFGLGAARATDAQTAAETALVALTLATAFGFCRLFFGWSWLATLVLAALASHLLAIFCRRQGIGLTVSALVSLVGLVLFTSLVFYRDTSAFGLPTRASWHVMTGDLSSAWHEFGTAIALVEPRTGFVVAAAAALWLSAFLSDGFAFRAGAGPEMLVAPGIIFVFCSALAAERFRLLSTALWLGCAILAYALHRSLLQDDSSGWLTTHRRGTITAATRIGAVLGVGAIGIGLLVGPILPGAADDPIINTRNPRSGTRQTISPLVDIQGRIASQSEVEVFTVKSPEPEYWRLTALDEFDGRIWSSARTYRDASGRLGGGLDSNYTTPLEQDFTITGLDSLWYPAAYAPTRISIGDDVRYDPETSSIVTKSANTQEGTAYTIESAIPNVTPDELRAATQSAPANIQTHYTELPTNFPPDLRRIATEITAGSPTEYDKALALQEWFRNNFTYDLNVEHGHGITAIEAFLQQQKGYCEQFAGTFAAFARALGMPARVGVGFTPGTLMGDGLYHVDGKHAHAWPEVYFTGIGWVPFEPTPTRGAPGAESWTGVPAQQVDQPPATVAPSTTVVAGASGASVTVSPLPTDNDRTIGGIDLGDLGGGGGFTPQSSGRPWYLTAGITLVVLALLAGAWLLVVPRLVRMRWNRRRHAAQSRADQVLVSWHETEASLARAGVAPIPSETPSEYASRAARSMRLDPVMLDRLAGHVTVAAYSDRDVGTDVVADAADIRDTVDRTIIERADLKTRLVWRADPRPLLVPLPGDHERRRHLELVNSGE